MDYIKSLSEIVSENMGKEITLTEQTTFDDLGFDSLDKVELLMAVEYKFGFTFPDDVMANNVAELIEVIKKSAK